MKLFISVTTAWLSTVGVFILSIIYLLRILAKKFEIEWIANLNKIFRKIHTPLCHITLLLAILHGLFSSIPIISANPGTLAIFLILLMGLLAMLKKKLKKFWMPSHRVMTLMVCVLVENSEIVSVEIVSHNEVGEHIYGKAFNSVPFEIINKQTTDVESVCGATYSSYGIMLAVEDALKDAVKIGKLPVIELPRGIRLK